MQKKIYGIDFSGQMIACAKEKLAKYGIENVEVDVCDCCKLPFPDRIFDVVIISNLIHVIKNPEFAIEEAKRVIQNDGKIIISTYLHDENNLSRIISFFMRMKGHPVERRFNAEMLKNLVVQSSLDIICEEMIKNIIPVSYVITKKQL